MTQQESQDVVYAVTVQIEPKEPLVDFIETSSYAEARLAFEDMCVRYPSHMVLWSREEWDEDVMLWEGSVVAANFQEEKS